MYFFFPFVWKLACYGHYRYKEMDKMNKQKGRAMMLCRLLFLVLFTWINLSHLLSGADIQYFCQWRREVTPIRESSSLAYKENDLLAIGWLKWEASWVSKFRFDKRLSTRYYWEVFNNLLLLSQTRISLISDNKCEDILYLCQKKKMCSSISIFIYIW